MPKFALLQLLVLVATCLLITDAAAFIQTRPNRPPIGAIYEKAIEIPVLGDQTFSLRILSDDTAHLLVKGMLFLDEIVAYTVSKSGRLNCRLSDHAISRLRKVRASLKEVGYDGETDTPYVKVSTPLPMPVKIKLKRKASAILLEEEESEALSSDDEEGLLLY